MALRFAARWPAAQGSVLFAFSQHLRTNRRAKSCAYWFDMLGYSIPPLAGLVHPKLQSLLAFPSMNSASPTFSRKAICEIGSTFFFRFSI